MSRTNGRFEAKTPFTDGVITLTPNNLTEGIAVPLGSLTTATDLVGYHIPASKTALIFGFVGPNLLRTGMAPFIQEQFGTAAGVAGPSGVANTSDPIAAPSPYLPPFTGSPIVVTSGFVPKGIKPLSLDIAYQVTTNDVTTLNIKMIARQFINNAAVSDTVLFAQTNLTKTQRAGIYLINTAVTTPAFVITPDTIIQVIINAVTPAASTLDIYALALKVAYNFN